MAEIPPGPSSLLPPPPPAVAEPCRPFPAGAAPVCSEDEEDDEEHRGGREGGGGGGGGGRGPAGQAAPSKGHQRLHCPQTAPSSRPPPPPAAPQQPQEQQQQQLNGLISPELRHLRAAASLKSKIVGAADTTSGAATDGNPRATAAKRAGQPPSERPPHTLPSNARTAPPNPAAPAAARNGLAGGTEQEEGEESLLLLSSSLTAVCSLTTSSDREAEPEEARTIRYVRYESELQMPDIMRLITKDLSEPYSIYTYRYFIHNWPQLCFLAVVGEECVGAIVCKLDMHKKMFRRGYIAMLAVDSKYRRNGIGTNLVKKAIYAMVEGDCDEVQK
ncbi:N-alpha-acetyltransferase 30 isoform X2 [Petaurus breviceps papuanus]|uniref:N-alpha-acetyltransferase 30 isoform X2 n=1 Tax=Petaurus breviceps papuanus TaxID=3040969 RepID=UPI0036DF13DC